jgi:hypothetical protein
MRHILLPMLTILSCCAMELDPICDPAPKPKTFPKVDVYVFGASYHRYNNGYHWAKEAEKPRSVNPGLGLGLMWERGGGWEMGGTVAAYSDSQGNPASSMMFTVRKSWHDRISVDASVGYYRGSIWRMYGAATTVGVRVVGPVWVHGMYVPEPVIGKGFSLGVALLRVRL